MHCAEFKNSENFAPVSNASLTKEDWQIGRHSQSKRDYEKKGQSEQAEK